MKASVGCLTTIVLGFGSSFAQEASVQLLLPGSEYHASELPADMTGRWWVLHRTGDAVSLASLEIVVEPRAGCSDEDPNRPGGRLVRVSHARNPILILRGLPELTAGPVRTAFLDRDGTGVEPVVEAQWGEQRMVLRHTAELPSGDQPGRYWVAVAIDERRYELRTDQWHGDGHWRVRWIGDLNRDGAPDLLLDASYKYSVHTTRLYLTHQADGRLQFDEVSQIEHTAC